MAVPIEIRQVERPKNTIVVDNGGNSVYRYAVRSRKTVKYISNGNPQPINGSVIGHIINNKYVSLDEGKNAFKNKSKKTIKTKVVHNTHDLKDTQTSEIQNQDANKVPYASFGASALIRSVSDDIENDLIKSFGPDYGYRIFTIAALRVMKPEIPISRLASAYSKCFMSAYVPGMKLSSTTLYKFFNMLRISENQRIEFFENRLKQVSKDHHIIIDGTLKKNTSIVNDLSAFSYKARLRGAADISVIYAYDLETLEPLCSQVFPGNCIDSTAYGEFIRTNRINKGIILSDKGFPPSKIEYELNEHKNLHFLTPIKRFDSRIKNYQMLNFDSVVKGTEKRILCKKSEIKGGRFLYSFKDSNDASHEEIAFIERAKKNTLDKEQYQKKKDLFGVIVFESDLDLTLEDVYKIYGERWKIEVLFRAYKNELNLDKTGFQGDFSIIGSEFINFIATTISKRVVKKAQASGLLNEMTYKELFDDLSSAWRRTDASIFKPKRDDGNWVHTNIRVFDMMEKLGLINTP